MDTDGKDRNELARNRTGLAEDRTILANERTYAGWMRTGLGCIGVGLGFRALLRTFEPAWLAKSIATLFILAGVAIIWLAWRRACGVLRRLDVHEVDTLPLAGMRWLSYGLIASALALAGVLWML
ncbi:hypothetical protein GCM10028862_01110 [Luteimonas pelagia]